MRLPFNGIRNISEVMEQIKSERNLNGDDVRNMIIAKGEAAGFLWRKERNIRGFNECPFDLVLGDKQLLGMWAIEIKGDTDNFSRLSAQLVEYMFGFGSVYIALHKKAAPEWLPGEVGILRVKENGDVFTELQCAIRDPLRISTEWEWDTLFRANGLGVIHSRVRDILGIVGSIRKNVIFNRMFAVPDESGAKKFETFYPFTEKQCEVIMGFDIGYHAKQIDKDIGVLEKRLALLKTVCAHAKSGYSAQGQLSLRLAGR